MKILLSLPVIVAASLLGSASETTAAAEATLDGSAIPAGQRPVAGWYRPLSNRGGYTPHWPVPPAGNGQLPPGYPQHGQFQSITTAPVAAQNPLGAELKQTQDQLTANRTALDKAHAEILQLRGELLHSLEEGQTLIEMVMASTSEQQALQARVTELNAELKTTTAALELNRRQIADHQEQTRTLTAERDRLRTELTGRDAQLSTMQAELRAATEALQEAKSDSVTSAEALRTATEQAGTLKSELAELSAELESQENTRISTEQSLAGERDQLRDKLASRDAQLTTLQTELQAATQALQQTQTAPTTSTGELSEARAQAETLESELAELSAKLESQERALLDSEKTLAEVIAERDELQASMAASSEQLTQVQAALTGAQSEIEELSEARSAAATAVAPTAAQGEALEEDAVEIAALQAAGPDTDGDGVPDDLDLCLVTQQGIAVESTGCAADTAIHLKGVHFDHDSHELTDEARHNLDRIADILSRQTDLRLQVAGHTDTQGDPAYNQLLSLKRAQAVRDYLVARGLNPSHIGAAGYGSQRPIADSTTKEGPGMNQRIELRSLK